jgi:CheY-like chemotaxis protein
MSPSSPLPVRSVLVVDADSVAFDLIREWLEPEGWRVLEFDARGTREVDATPSLLVVDLGFARDAGMPALARLREAAPGVPVLVMSPTIFDGVCCSGPCARRLGVAGVLPKPLSREAFVTAVADLARPARAVE